METKKHKVHPVVRTEAPKEFCIAGHTFAIADFAGVTAETIKKRLAKAGVNVSTAWAKAFCERINKKGE